MCEIGLERGVLLFVNTLAWRSVELGYYYCVRTAGVCMKRDDEDEA